jgi:3-phenylpropionate/trans-cinnamate dioxygenase ferredoxin subunit
MTTLEPGQARPLAFPPGLRAVGASEAAFRPLLAVAELPPGALRRVTIGDLDVLLAHTGSGIAAVDDRCPHMSAPLSLGELDGCVVTCPLHEGRFDLASGGAVQMPTTGCLDADGAYHPTWSPSGRLTRVRRLRYYPVRILDGMIEAAIPGP